MVATVLSGGVNEIKSSPSTHLPAILWNQDSDDLGADVAAVKQSLFQLPVSLILPDYLNMNMNG